MTDDDRELLEKEGWDIECESPLEIRCNETGSFATQLAANYVILYLRSFAYE